MQIYPSDKAELLSPKQRKLITHFLSNTAAQDIHKYV